LQPNKPKKGKKKVAAAPLAAKKVEPKKVVNPLFEKRPKNFGIGMLIVTECNDFVRVCLKIAIH